MERLSFTSKDWNSAILLSRFSRECISKLSSEVTSQIHQIYLKGLTFVSGSTSAYASTKDQSAWFSDISGAILT